MAGPAAGTLHQVPDTSAGRPASQPAAMLLRKPHYLHTRSPGSLPRLTLPASPGWRPQVDAQTFKEETDGTRGLANRTEGLPHQSLPAAQNQSNVTEGQVPSRDVGLIRKPLLSPLEIKTSESHTPHPTRRITDCHSSPGNGLNIGPRTPPSFRPPPPLHGQR